MIVLTQLHDKFDKSPDAEYMSECAKVDHNRPATWSKYPSNIQGANEIIAMEYTELMTAAKAGKMDEWKENLFHLSVACLNAWRLYEHK